MCRSTGLYRVTTIQRVAILSRRLSSTFEWINSTLLPPRMPLKWVPHVMLHYHVWLHGRKLRRFSNKPAKARLSTSQCCKSSLAQRERFCCDAPAPPLWIDWSSHTHPHQTRSWNPSCPEKHLQFGKPACPTSFPSVSFVFSVFVAGQPYESVECCPSKSAGRELGRYPAAKRTSSRASTWQCQANRIW